MSNGSKRVTYSDVVHDAFVVTEFIEWIRLVSERTPTLTIDFTTLWQVYQRGVINCEAWETLFDELYLPNVFHEDMEGF